jgi:hypothetical protein
MSTSLEIGAKILGSCDIQPVRQGEMSLLKNDQGYFTLSTKNPGGRSAVATVYTNVGNAFDVVVSTPKEFMKSPESVRTAASSLAFLFPKQSPQFLAGGPNGIQIFEPEQRRNHDKQQSVSASLHQPGTDTLEVDLEVISDNKNYIFPPGDYLTSITITCVAK